MSDNACGTESIPSREDPFILRAHHARQLFQLLALGWDLEVVEESSETFALQHLPKSYYLDTYGPSPATAKAFRDNAEAYHQEFLDLPPDAIVKIATNQKDKICDGCAIGSHCDESGGDKAWLKAVVTTAELLGLDHTLEAAEETIIEGNGITKKVSAVYLPADVARTIFADIEYRSRTAPRLLRFILRSADNRSVQRA